MKQKTATLTVLAICTLVMILMGFSILSTIQNEIALYSERFTVVIVGKGTEQTGPLWLFTSYYLLGMDGIRWRPSDHNPVKLPVSEQEYQQNNVGSDFLWDGPNRT